MTAYRHAAVGAACAVVLAGLIGLHVIGSAITRALNANEEPTT